MCSPQQGLAALGWMEAEHRGPGQQAQWWSKIRSGGWCCCQRLGGFVVQRCLPWGGASTALLPTHPSTSHVAVSWSPQLAVSSLPRASPCRVWSGVGLGARGLGRGPTPSPRVGRLFSHEPRVALNMFARAPCLFRVGGRQPLLLGKGDALTKPDQKRWEGNILVSQHQDGRMGELGCDGCSTAWSLGAAASAARCYQQPWARRLG